MTIVQLNNICKSFGTRNIFKNLNLEITENEFVCITGKSGKGKTTLLNIMGMLEHPDTGDVSLFGVSNPKLNSRNGRKILRNKLAFVFQNFGLVEDRTVKYNLQICSEFSKKNRNANYIEALTNVGLSEEYLNEKVFHLSGGEQQRVALARLFIHDCSLILADEPTGSLDYENRDNVIEIFKELHRQGKTIVVVTHDNEVAKCAERIIEL